MPLLIVCPLAPETKAQRTLYKTKCTKESNILRTETHQEEKKYKILVRKTLIICIEDRGYLLAKLC